MQHQSKVIDATKTKRHWRGKDLAGCTTSASKAMLDRAQVWRLKTSVPLVPPKPKLFFTATSMRASRAVLAQ